MTSTINNFQTEHVFSIPSEEDLIQSFRRKDQKKLVLPDGLKFPLNVRSYFTWRESSGVYTYLVFKMPNWDLPKGVTFKRMSPSGDQAGGLCNWCNSYGASDDIAMLSVAMDANVSFSYFLCQDLRCIEKIEEAATLGGKNPEKWISELYYKMEKLFERMSNYKPE